MKKIPKVPSSAPHLPHDVMTQVPGGRCQQPRLLRERPLRLREVRVPPDAGQVGQRDVLSGETQRGGRPELRPFSAQQKMTFEKRKMTNQTDIIRTTNAQLTMGWCTEG